MTEAIVCLVIDDDADDQAIFGFAADKAFPRVECFFCGSCEEAILKLSGKQIPVPGFIFLDWRTALHRPETYILQLMAIYGLQDTCLFILSGSPPPVSATSLKQLGIKRVILKQNSIEELSDELFRAVHDID